MNEHQPHSFPPLAMQAGRGFYLAPDEPGGGGGGPGTGSPDPEGGTGKGLSAEDVNAIITGRLKGMGLHEVKGTLEGIAGQLTALSSAQPKPDASGDPEPKPGTMAALEAQVAAQAEENAKLLKLVSASNDSVAEQVRRQQFGAALASAGVPVGSVKYLDALGQLMLRQDIKDTGQLTPDGQPVFVGEVQTQHGPNPAAPLAVVVAGFVKERPYLLPPGSTGGAGGGEHGIVLAGAAPGSEPITLENLTAEQAENLTDAQAEALWVSGGGKPAGQQQGMYPVRAAAPAK